MSLEAMQKEIQSQAEDLPRVASQLRKLPAFNISRSRILFAGSGDSYAASLFAHQLTGGEAGAFDPVELFSQVEAARGRVVVLVSVSGRTKANIRLARRLKGIGKKTIAITADPKSLLASLCDEVFELHYTKSKTLTSGTISFTSTILVIAHLLGILPHHLELSKGFEKATYSTLAVRVPNGGGLYFVGSGINNSLAEYGACKIHEVLGAKAVALFPEQVGHAALFSVDRERDVIIGIQSGRQDPTRRVIHFLKNSRFRTLSINPESRNVVVRSMEACFYLQQLALALARRRGLNECAFLADRSRLELSNRLIY